MANIRQQKTALKVKEVIEKNLDMNKGEILRMVGYSPKYSNYPKLVFESKGFKEALAQLGFSVEGADMTIAKILRTGKEENQLRAGDMIYKRLGAYQQTEGNKTLIVNISSESAKRYEVEPNETSQHTS